MKLLQVKRISAFLIFGIIAAVCNSAELKADDWVKVQNFPVKVYQNTRTGLYWSVTIANAGNSNANAIRIAHRYGFRLPSWNEIRDVVNNNNAINWLEMESGLFDLYETDDPNVLAGAFGGSVDTKRPRQPVITQTWVLGVSKYPPPGPPEY